MRTWRTATALTALLLMAAACGGNDQTDETAGEPDTPNVTESPGGNGESGDVVNQQPPGQAYVMVDGLEYTMTEPGGIGCSIAEDSVTFSHRIGDNEVTLGGGASLADGAWFGAIDMTVANPEGENGPITYYPDLAVNGDGIEVSGASMSYSGPMLKQPAQDGSNPSPVDVGEGVISVTCG
ncbi:MAG TPA: hypothetical protein VFS66_13670 [Acidimicrobiia bacterium]|nr:hypothetical protein [Acidimicrobiia bacterium]